MKKLTVLFSALLMLGATASFAGDKKGKKGSCCKGKTEQCTKEKKEACDKGRGCCQKGANKGTTTSSSTTTTTTTNR